MRDDKRKAMVSRGMKTEFIRVNLKELLRLRQELYQSLQEPLPDRPPEVSFEGKVTDPHGSQVYYRWLVLDRWEGPGKPETAGWAFSEAAESVVVPLLQFSADSCEPRDLLGAGLWLGAEILSTRPRGKPPELLKFFVTEVAQPPEGPPVFCLGVAVAEAIH